MAAFEGFCADRRLVEKQVVESLIAHFMRQDAESREIILMTRYETGADQPPLRVAAKKATPQKSTKARPGSSKRSKPGEG